MQKWHRYVPGMSGGTGGSKLKTKTLDLGNNEQAKSGVFKDKEGYTAMTFTRSKQFKTKAGAESWYKRNTGESSGKRRKKKNPMIPIKVDVWENPGGTTIHQKTGRTEMKEFTRSSVANVIRMQRKGGKRKLMAAAFREKKTEGHYTASKMR